MGQVVDKPLWAQPISRGNTQALHELCFQRHIDVNQETPLNCGNPQDYIGPRPKKQAKQTSVRYKTMTPVLFAIHQNQIACLQELLLWSPELNKTTLIYQNRLTPIGYAVLLNRSKMVSLLLLHGPMAAAVELTVSQKTFTPLDLA
jgi:hypothetical protein